MARPVDTEVGGGCDLAWPTQNRATPTMETLVRNFVFMPKDISIHEKSMVAGPLIFRLRRGQVTLPSILLED